VIKLGSAATNGQPWTADRSGRGARDGRAAGVVGHGEAAFHAAVDALREWRAHAGFGARVTPAGAAIAVGTDVVVDMRLGPFDVSGACRIVEVYDESRRFGFEYATLPGHLLGGTEAFVVEWRADDTVQFTVEAVSEPAAPVTWLGLPVVRAIQRRARSAFVSGIAAHVTETMEGT